MWGCVLLEYNPIATKKTIMLYCLDNKLTYGELAVKAKLNKQTLYQFMAEKGKAKALSIHTLFALASVMAVSLDILCGREVAQCNSVH